MKQEKTSLPASPEMAEKLRINQTGRLTRAQRRVALVAGLGALIMMACPLVFLAQMIGLAVVGNLAGVGSLIIALLATLLVLLFAGLISVNAQTFLPEAFMRQPVKVARGPLEFRETAGKRPELPFSYIVADYSFAPYVAPPDLPRRIGAPYIVYYAARSRLLLSMAALDAPDGSQWESQFNA